MNIHETELGGVSHIFETFKLKTLEFCFCKQHFSVFTSATPQKKIISFLTPGSLESRNT